MEHEPSPYEPPKSSIGVAEQKSREVVPASKRLRFASLRASQQLSSSMTFFFKFTFTVIFSMGTGIAITMFFVVESPEKFKFLVVWTIVTILFWPLIYKLKNVELLGPTLIVSNYKKTIEVPLSDVASISENRLIGMHPISIHLKRPTEFGNKIVFMPVLQFYLPFGSHPIYKELKELVD